MDGETDWKLRRSINYTQQKGSPENLHVLDGEIIANPPTNKIYDFKGVFRNSHHKEPLNLENTLWSNTVLASNGYIIASVLYTGRETRA